MSNFQGIERCLRQKLAVIVSGVIAVGFHAFKRLLAIEKARDDASVAVAYEASAAER